MIIIDKSNSRLTSEKMNPKIFLGRGMSQPKKEKI